MEGVNMVLSEKIALKDLVDALNDEIFVPNIQRGFEWDEERIEKFLDSIVKRIPVGMILLYRHDTDKFKIFVRKFFIDYDENRKKEEFKYEEELEKGKIAVIDGQQRLQSLQIAFYGTYYGQRLYHNIFWQKESDKRKRIKEPSFKFKKSSEIVLRDDDGIWIRFDKLVKLTEEVAKIPTTIPLRDRLKEFNRLLQKYNLGGLQPEEERDFFDYIFSDLKDILFTPMRLGEVMKITITSEIGITLDQLLETFIRFNSGGLRLQKSDILFAVLKTEWKDIQYQLSLLTMNDAINIDLLLKALIVVSGISYEPSRMPDEDIIKEENLNKLKNCIERFSTVIEKFYDKLKDITPIPERILKKFYFLIPVVYYFYHNPSELNKGLLELPEILEYILIIKYNSNLRSDSHLRKIIEIIEESEQAKFPLKSIKDYLRKVGVKTIIDGDSLNKDPILTFSLLQRRNWRPYRSKLHIDHIFPKAKVEELPEKARPLIDSIWNKYVVFEGDNLRKGKKMPDEHFIGEREKLLKYYMLPDEKEEPDYKELLKKENAYECLKWRMKKIKKKFKEELGIEIQLP